MKGFRLAAGAAAVLACVSCAGTRPATGGQTGSGRVVSVTAVKEVYGDGQQVAAVAVEYDTAIDGASLSVADFTVEGREVAVVYTAAAAGKTAGPGNFVIVELTPLAAAAAGGGGMSPGGGMGERPAGEGGWTPPDGAEGGPDMNGAGMNSPGAGGPQAGRPGDDNNADAVEEAPVAVVQTGDITTAAGVVYAASAAPLESTKTVTPIVDDFQQFEYTDPATGLTLRYNLFIPAGYDPAVSYPLVLFIHDAGECGTEVTRTLTQGLGAVIWASPEEQAKHPCFVLAPEYAAVTVDDAFNTTEDLVTTVALVKDIVARYSIDADRVYTTGQSMGCMSSIVLMLREPDLFAAAMLVAGQWDTTIMAPLAAKNLFILVSEGDTKASPGMDAAAAVWEAEGASIARARWNGEAPPEEAAANVAALLAQGADINYVTFEGGSHTYTWQVAYGIEGVRDWLLAQRR